MIASWGRCTSGRRSPRNAGASLGAFESFIGKLEPSRMSCRTANRLEKRDYESMASEKTEPLLAMLALESSSAPKH